MAFKEGPSYGKPTTVKSSIVTAYQNAQRRQNQRQAAQQRRASGLVLQIRAGESFERYTYGEIDKNGNRLSGFSGPGTITLRAALVPGARYAKRIINELETAERIRRANKMKLI